MVCDHGVLSAHDSRNTDRLLCVADHQCVMIQISCLSVKGDKFLPVLGSADNDLMAFNRIQVISMHWLTIFFHNVVGNIDDVINGTDSL